MLPPSGSVLGIDVGWSLKQRSSAICRLDWTEGEVTWEVRHFTAEPAIRQEAVATIAGSRHLLAAALDGPLRGDLTIIDRYRAAERALTQKHISSRISQPGSSRSPVGRLLNHHTNEFARLLLDCGDIADATHRHAIHPKTIVEGFPTSFLGLMLDNPEKGLRQHRSDRYFEAALQSGVLDRILVESLPGRTPRQDPSPLTHHDDRAAFVCALTALLVAADDYTAVGDGDGWIILPPPRFIAAWAQPVVRSWNNREGLQL
jgi:hypothetical protein